MLSLRALLLASFSPVRTSAGAGARPVLRANLFSTPTRSAAFMNVAYDRQRARPPRGALPRPADARLYLHGSRRRAPQALPQCPKPLACHLCGGEGHIWSVCPAHDPLTQPMKACRRCGEKGHVVNKCTKPLTCYRCGSAEHMLDVCAQPLAQ
ncbi:hypothetical protein DFH09DRAFT_1315606 [Mycena vulgaris]|nr:hypothetical protein DFH09DRAFT_1315606 [Mycena vulgaris]